MCIVPLKSMTAAQKGKAALISAGIPCEITALEPMMTKNGCAYGLYFSCGQKEKVKAILSKKHIYFGKIMGGAF